MIAIRSEKEIELIRQSGRILAAALSLAESRIAAGVVTGELDEEIAAYIIAKGGRPAFKGYNGYPANTCISIDDQVVHGIPGKRAMREGEIVSVDVGVLLNGYYSDAARTFKVGTVDRTKERLMQITRESLEKGIAAAVDGNRLSDIGHAIQSHVEAAGFSVVRDLVGHGIGQAMHEEPQIPNYGVPDQGPRLKTGMVLAIEPMVNAGSWRVRTLEDQWTVVTADGKPSAHYEHTVAVRKGGAEILTLE
ncbi:MAG TPA: type I methionyl aminopeptidase [bacterium]|nr:type I methionyl aminopeptidase [bacterium]HQG44952.1 type I methionyl aminopeptidase [bacterium]HQI47869.1 type I methionyl aminopeptidase [bacterium]HQJ66187.1 type I methionyl aminopeptidase [bacterium]